MRGVRELDKTNMTRPAGLPFCRLYAKLRHCTSRVLIDPLSALPCLLQPKVIYLWCYTFPCLTVFGLVQPQATISTCIAVSLQQGDTQFIDPQQSASCNVQCGTVQEVIVCSPPLHHLCSHKSHYFKNFAEYVINLRNKRIFKYYDVQNHNKAFQK